MADVSIRALKNGPYEVTGSAAVTDQKRNAYKGQGDPIYLCRCGQSANKPFCDGTHTKVGFKAEETAG
jgi:CDGSH-type Zn-finger protein